MSESDNDKFLRLAGEYRELDKQIKELAWQITPDDIKKLLCWEYGFCVTEEAARNWLTKPHPWLDEKSPAEVIANNEADKVRKLIDDKLTGAPI